jgi:predicted ATPase/DNA-binding CsgD family transcriptional regulator
MAAPMAAHNAGLMPLPDGARGLDSLAEGVFVGRQTEMHTLQAALENTLAGHGRLVMLAGEPGIGKTRVAREFASHAEQRGALVLWGRCSESAGAAPYWPWVQIVRAYVRDRDTEQLHTAMGAGAVDMADMVPEVQERLSDLPWPPRLDDPEQERFRLFDAVTAFLCRVARTSPLVLILDNLHWADTPSLRLLEFLAPELDGSRVLVLGTYRDMELTRHSPLSETLGELTRTRPLHRLLLQGLSYEEVGHFIVATTGVLPPHALVQAVYTQTEGNPLFLTEVVRPLMQEGAFAPERLHQSHQSVLSTAALAISRELGMCSLEERVVALLEPARSHPTKTRLYPSGLTSREVEVLRLIATGKSNRDIADTLYISLSTVATHVRNILTKTGTANRTEAAAYALHQGLG